MYDPGMGRWMSQDPIGFKAGDSNLYRYVGNSPTNGVDPSGLVNGWNHHPYPLYLGGSASQIVVDLSGTSTADGIRRHNLIHQFLERQGFGFGNAGRAAWARLTPRQQQAMIIRSLRAGGVSNSFIRANIAGIMRGATPGIATPRPSGFPGGVARVPLLSIAGGAILEILMNPSTAHAAEIDRTWRGLPPNTMGNVYMTEVTYAVDAPRFWNLTHSGGPIPVWSYANPQGSLDLGQMTVREARQLEGIIESTEEGNAFGLDTPPRFGYYRLYVTYSVVFFERAPNPVLRARKLNTFLANALLWH